MPDVTLDLFPDSGGRYAVDWKIGLGQPWAELSGATANLYLSAPPPLEHDCRRLAFHEAVRYPHGLQPLVESRGSIQVYIYRPVDRETILAFDRRINVRYVEFFDPTGEHAAGTFDVLGLSSPCIAELAAMEAPSRAEFERITSGLQIPEDIEAIVTECRALQDRSWERYVLWLTPIS